MAPIVAATIQAYIDAGRNCHTAADQGRALKDLICYVMSQIPGVAITHRNELNAFETEEIDVAIWNDGAAEGFFFAQHHSRRMQELVESSRKHRT